MSEPQTLTIDVNGFPTRVWRAGSGPKLGFLAGFGGLPRWMPVLDELAKSRTLIVPSLPGFPGGDRGHSVLDSHLDWMLAVRETLEKADLSAPISPPVPSALPWRWKWPRCGRTWSAVSPPSPPSVCSTKKIRPPIPGRNERIRCRALCAPMARFTRR